MMSRILIALLAFLPLPALACDVGEERPLPDFRKIPPQEEHQWVEAKLLQNLRGFDSTSRHLVELAEFDLNGDGNKEVFVRITSQYCGFAGICGTEIRDGKDNSKVLFPLKEIMTAYTLETTSSGYADLITHYTYNDDDTKKPMVFKRKFTFVDGAYKEGENFRCAVETVTETAQ